MKFTPYLAIVFGQFYREITRAEAAEILRRARENRTKCIQITKGMICLGPLDLFTKNI